MDNAQLLDEIRETNLTYLLLAQRMIKDDKAAALFRLGITKEAAELIETLSPAQLLKIAAGNMLDFFHLRDTPLGRTVLAARA